MAEQLRISKDVGLRISWRLSWALHAMEVNAHIPSVARKTDHCAEISQAAVSILMKNLRADLKVNRRNPFIVSALFTYRFGHFVHYHVRVPLLRQILKIAYGFMDAFFIRILSHAEIPAKCHIGAGLHLPHGANGIVIHRDAKIGEYVTIYHQVTIGAKDPCPPDEYGVPEIGDGAFIGVGAKILGDLKIGDRAMIGANSVVLIRVESDATAVGIPARCLLNSRSHNWNPSVLRDKTK